LPPKGNHHSRSAQTGRCILIPSFGHEFGRPMFKAASMLVCALTLMGCSTLFGRPEQGQTVQERARICFHQSEDDAHIIASVAPTDCYSIRCTRWVQGTGTAVVRQQTFQLDFKTTFILQKTRPLLGNCTPDCAGGGQLDFDLGPLDVGLYRVDLWDTGLGRLSVTSGLPWQDQCLPEGPSDQSGN